MTLYNFQREGKIVAREANAPPSSLNETLQIHVGVEVQHTHPYALALHNNIILQCS